MFNKMMVEKFYKLEKESSRYRRFSGNPTDKIRKETSLEIL
jgi:hypothetical protein